MDGFHTFGGWIPWNGGWIPYFFQMDSILFPWNGGWTPYFFKMDFMEWGMDSILFQDGIHGMGDGLNIFFLPFSQVQT